MVFTHVAGSLHSGMVPVSPQWLRRPADVNALDPALWPASARRDADGELILADQPVSELLDEYLSPLYVVDEAEFRHRARDFRRAFPGWTVYYAGKAFLTKAVARWVAEDGLNLDVCSGNELALALAAGFPPERIGLHGNNKSAEELRQAVAAGVGHIIVDSLDEIARLEDLTAELGRDATVLVRVTTGVEAHTHEYIATAVEDQKFGFSVHGGQALMALVRCQTSPHLNLAGLHSHIGSQIFDTDGFEVAAQRTMRLMAQFHQATGVYLPELDLGGGFGIAYTEQDTPSTPDELNAGLMRIVDQARRGYDLPELTLSIEPGRGIAGPAGVALYTVGTVKVVDLEGGAQRVYVSVDGGMSDNIRPALYAAEYSAILANRTSSAETVLCRVVGKHCEAGDILVHDVFLPADIIPGDILAVPSAGAYSRSMASNYNYLVRPAVVAIGPAGTYPLLRRETFDDLMRLDQG